VKSGSGAWTRTRILGSKGPCATNCTTPEAQKNCTRPGRLVRVSCSHHALCCLPYLLLMSGPAFAATSCATRLPPFGESARLDESTRGEVSERFKEHAWKACVGETQPWVQIPPSPPFCDGRAAPATRMLGTLTRQLCRPPGTRSNPTPWTVFVSCSQVGNSYSWCILRVRSLGLKFGR
jgi:hypothetical protein